MSHFISFKYSVDNFKFPTMPSKEFAWNSSESVSVWAHTNNMKASSRYLGLEGKHFQGYQNDFEAESISGCGAPWPRIDNAELMPGYPKLVGAGCDNGGEKQVNYDKTTTGHHKAGLLLMTTGGSHVPTERRERIPTTLSTSDLSLSLMCQEPDRP